MEIQFERDGYKGALYVEEDDIRIANMSLGFSDNNILIINHTEVSENLRGTGTSKHLIAEAVRLARENGWKIIVVCPYASLVIAKNRDYDDVLKK